MPRRKRKKKKQVPYRKIAFNHYPHLCAKCGWDKAMTALEVHHRDGNRKNNQLRNLIILCGTCHILTHRKIKESKRRKLQTHIAAK